MSNEGENHSTLWRVATTPEISTHPSCTTQLSPLQNKENRKGVKIQYQYTFCNLWVTHKVINQIYKDQNLKQ